MEEREPQQHESPEIVKLGHRAELAEHQVPGEPLDSPFNAQRPARDVLDQLSVTRQAAPQLGPPRRNGSDVTSGQERSTSS